MAIEPHLYKSVNMDLAHRVAMLENEVNERDEFITRLLKLIRTVAPVVADAMAKEAPATRRYEACTEACRIKDSE